MFSVIASGTNASASVWSSGFISSGIYTSKLCLKWQHKSSELLEHSEMFARVEQKEKHVSTLFRLYPTLSNFYTFFSPPQNSVLTNHLALEASRQIFTTFFQFSTWLYFKCLSVSERGAKEVCEKTRQAGTQIWLRTRVSIWSFYQTKKRQIH